MMKEFLLSAKFILFLPFMLTLFLLSGIEKAKQVMFEGLMFERVL